MADGYNIYRGVGGVSSVDFDTAVGFSATATVDLATLGHAASTKYTYVIRPTRSDVECPDLGCSVELKTDAAGEWVGSVPDSVPWFDATVNAGGSVTLNWRYTTGDTTPTSFDIWHGGLKIDLTGDADENVAYSRDGLSSTTLTLAGGTYYFAIKAKTALASSSATILGPVLVDTTAPDTPTVLSRTRF